MEIKSKGTFFLAFWKVNRKDESSPGISYDQPGHSFVTAFIWDVRCYFGKETEKFLLVKSTWVLRNYLVTVRLSVSASPTGPWKAGQLCRFGDGRVEKLEGLRILGKLNVHRLNKGKIMLIVPHFPMAPYKWRTRYLSDRQMLLPHRTINWSRSVRLKMDSMQLSLNRISYLLMQLWHWSMCCMLSGGGHFQRSPGKGTFAQE